VKLGLLVLMLVFILVLAALLLAGCGVVLSSLGFLLSSTLHLADGDDVGDGVLLRSGGIPSIFVAGDAELL
jgi:hypothetical protein